MVDETVHFVHTNMCSWSQFSCWSTQVRTQKTDF